MSSSIIDLPKADLLNLIAKSMVPIIIEFYDPKLASSKLLESVINEIADDYWGQIITCKVNIFDNLEIAKKFNVNKLQQYCL